jgi:serine/threonine-protein kinase
MAPEQWRLLPPDARTDVWALGTTLYELLTGELPFAHPGDHPISIGEAVASGAPPPALSSRLNAPVALDTVLRRALASARESRFPSAGDFARALENVARAVTSPSSEAKPSIRGIAARHDVVGA